MSIKHAKPLEGIDLTMLQQTNPLERLSNILHDVIYFGDENYSQNPELTISHTPAQEVWTLALDVPSGVEEFHNSLMDVVRLVDICEQFIERNSSIDAVGRQLYKSQLSDVKVIIFSVSVMDWAQFRVEFNDYFLRNLRWAARDMSRYYIEDVIPDGTIENLQSEIEDLISDVLASNLNRELKAILTDGLQAIRQSIVNYRLFGSEGIRVAVDRNVTLMARYRDEFENITEPESKKVLSDLWNFIVKADKIVAGAARLMPLANRLSDLVQRMLEGGD